MTLHEFRECYTRTQDLESEIRFLKLTKGPTYIQYQACVIVYERTPNRNDVAPLTETETLATRIAIAWEECGTLLRVPIHSDDNGVVGKRGKIYFLRDWNLTHTTESTEKALVQNALEAWNCHLQAVQWWKDEDDLEKKDSWFDPRRIETTSVWFE
jgi:hypothetical protein